MLPQFPSEKIVAGCDEAGRGCLAGPVFAAAVILPFGFHHELLNDSKLVRPKDRNTLRAYIEKEAVAYAVHQIDEKEIDEINILNASIKAMHHAVDSLKIKPKMLLIDGNQFKEHCDIPHLCIVKGDQKYKSIAAASILAKTYRDEYMTNLDKHHPQYGWAQNKGYPTKQHISAVEEYGYTTDHRRSFEVKSLKKHAD